MDIENGVRYDWSVNLLMWCCYFCLYCIYFIGWKLVMLIWVFFCIFSVEKFIVFLVKVSEKVVVYLGSVGKWLKFGLSSICFCIILMMLLFVVSFDSFEIVFIIVE